MYTNSNLPEGELAKPVKNIQSELPMISVIVPAYNVEKYIEKCLSSLVSQSFKDIEIIVINDGSTDKTEQIISEFAKKDKRINVITQENQGPSVARNKGMEIAHGKYISFVDSDDWVDSDFLEKLYNAIVSHDADISCTNAIRKRENSEKYRFFYEKEKEYESLKDKIEVCNIPNCCYIWNKLYRTNLIKNRKFKKDAYFEDMLWIPDVLKSAKRIVTVPNTNYYYRVNNVSIVKKYSDKKQMDSYYAHKYIINFFESNKLKLSKKYYTITKKIIHFCSIPIVKIKERNFVNTCYLCGFLPIFRFRDFDSHYIFKIFGIRLSLRHKSNFNYQEANEYGINTNKRSPQIIVSLTSHPPRIGTTAISINTLLRQTLKPDRLILWLAESQFPNKEKDLPSKLLKLTKLGLEIRWCEDLLSYKKLVPALREFPDDIIVTADDDLYYEENWLESLYSAYIADSKNIYVHRAVKMKIENGRIVAYKRDVQLNKNFDEPSFSNQLMGGSGCLFPPHSLYKDVFDVNKFLMLIPTHDDIYFWFMAILNGTKIGVVGGYKSEMIPIDRTESTSLCKINNNKGRGIKPDEAFERIVKQYPEVVEVLSNE